MNRRGEDGERVNSELVVDTGFVEQRGGRTANLCFEFQRTGSCSRGGACRYEHPSAGGGGGGTAATDSRSRLASLAEARLVRGADGEITLAAAGGEAPPVEKRPRDESRKEHRRGKDKHDKHKSSKKHKHKHKQREKSRRRSSGSEESDDSPARGCAGEAAPPPPDAQLPTISDDDYFVYNKEFSWWLQSTRGTYFTALSSAAARELFAVFVAEWNSRRLPAKLYAGEVVVSGRR